MIFLFPILGEFTRSRNPVELPEILFSDGHGLVILCSSFTSLIDSGSCSSSFLAELLLCLTVSLLSCFWMSLIISLNLGGLVMIGGSLPISDFSMNRSTISKFSASDSLSTTLQRQGFDSEIISSNDSGARVRSALNFGWSDSFCSGSGKLIISRGGAEYSVTVARQLQPAETEEETSLGEDLLVIDFFFGDFLGGSGKVVSEAFEFVGEL